MLIWVVWFIYDFKLAFLADAEWLLSRLRTLVPTKKLESYTHFEKIFLSKKIKPSPKLIGKG